MNRCLGCKLGWLSTLIINFILSSATWLFFFFSLVLYTQLPLSLGGESSMLIVPQSSTVSLPEGTSTVYFLPFANRLSAFYWQAMLPHSTQTIIPRENDLGRWQRKWYTLKACPLSYTPFSKSRPKPPSSLKSSCLSFIGMNYQSQLYIYMHDAKKCLLTVWWTKVLK